MWSTPTYRKSSSLKSPGNCARPASSPSPSTVTACPSASAQNRRPPRRRRHPSATAQTRGHQPAKRQRQMDDVRHHRRQAPPGTGSHPRRRHRLQAGPADHVRNRPQILRRRPQPTPSARRKKRDGQIIRRKLKKYSKNRL